MSLAQKTSPETTKPFPWVGLLVLSAIVFLTVTSETLPTGLLPDMSADLRVSEPQVGLLVTIFAFTVVVTSTPITALTRRWSRHGMIVGALAVLGLSNLLTAIAPSYEFVIGTRIFGGIAHGMFWAIVSAYAGHLVPKEQIGRAVSITLGGGTLAFVFGVPLGTATGHAFGWRLSFGLIGALMLLGTVVLWKFLPRIEREERPDARSDAPTRKARRDPTVAAVVLICVFVAVVVMGHYAFYTYVAPFMIDAMHVAPGDIAGLLFLYGIAGAVGLILAGSVLGRRPQGGIVLGIVVIGLSVAVLAAFAGQPVIAVPAFVLWGLAFGVMPPLMQTHLLHTASARFRDTASALYTTAFNLGIGGGALLGAIIYGAIGVEDLPWFYLGILAVGLVFVLIVNRVARTAAR